MTSTPDPLVQIPNNFTEMFLMMSSTKIAQMVLLCQQMILMKYHALFIILEKAAKFEIHLLQIIGGTLCVISLDNQMSNAFIPLLHNNAF